MKKTHLLSVLALGISAACHAETYPAPVGLHNLTWRRGPAANADSAYGA